MDVLTEQPTEAEKTAGEAAQVEAESPSPDGPPLSVEVPKAAGGVGGAGGGAQPMSPAERLRSATKKVQHVNRVSAMAHERRRPRGMSVANLAKEDEKAKSNVPACCSARPKETEPVRAAAARTPLCPHPSS